jgi:phosphoglycerol geranylgeranyltransferase
MSFKLGKIENWLHNSAREKKLFILLDPDHCDLASIATMAGIAAEAKVSGFLAGTSLMMSSHLASMIEELKIQSGLPVILFPGDAGQVVSQADAMLFLSLISGRNPQFLIGEHVRAAPQIARSGMECIPTAYMLVESGICTSAQFMSGSQPLPRNKPDIAVAHALAAKALGLRTLYLEAGSGALKRVPDEMITAVKSVYDYPLIVGGGIRDAKEVSAVAKAGADIVVVGSVIEEKLGDEQGLYQRISELMKALNE